MPPGSYFDNILHVDGMERGRVAHLVNHNVRGVGRLLSFLIFESVEVNSCHREQHVADDSSLI